MHLLRFLIRIFSVLLLLAFGTGGAFAAAGDWTHISYPVVVQELSASPVNLTNTAHAPPITSTNVMATGTAFAQTGDLRAFDGTETSGAVCALLRSSNATNTAGAGRYTPSQHWTLLEIRLSVQMTEVGFLFSPMVP